MSRMSSSLSLFWSTRTVFSFLNFLSLAFIMFCFLLLDVVIALFISSLEKSLLANSINNFLSGPASESYSVAIEGFQGSLFSSDAIIKHALTKLILNRVGARLSKQEGNRLRNAFHGFSRNMATKQSANSVR